MNTFALLRIRLLWLFTLAAVLVAGTGTIRADAVSVSEQDLAIPTYLAGDPEPNPDVLLWAVIRKERRGGFTLTLSTTR